MPEILSSKCRIGTPKKNAKVHAIVKLAGSFSEAKKAAMQEVCDGMGAQIDAIINPPKASDREGGGEDDT